VAIPVGTAFDDQFSAVLKSPVPSIEPPRPILRLDRKSGPKARQEHSECPRRNAVAFQNVPLSHFFDAGGKGRSRYAAKMGAFCSPPGLSHVNVSVVSGRGLPGPNRSAPRMPRGRLRCGVERPSLYQKPANLG
jgi:hypothetical protein